MSAARISEHARAILGRSLERGRTGGAIERLAERAWAATAGRRLARPVRRPEGVTIVGLGSAVLGGAGKTPLVIALARALAARGDAVAVVGHAYRAAPERARRVAPDDPVGAVGDDALDAARSLGDDAVPVFVAPSRGAAMAEAVRTGARVLLVDGLLQTRPRPLDASVLVLDASAPWGSGACPPLGDLRARPDDLLAVADVVAVLGASLPPSLGARATLVPTEITGAVGADGSVCALASLRRARVGVVAGIARPERVLAAVEAAGIAPVARLLAADHARFADLGRAVADLPRVDAWLTTTRCATKLPVSLRGAPVLALARRLDTADLVRALSGLAGSRRASPMEPSKTAEPLC